MRVNRPKHATADSVASKIAMVCNLTAPAGLKIKRAITACGFAPHATDTLVTAVKEALTAGSTAAAPAVGKIEQTLMYPCGLMTDTLMDLLINPATDSEDAELALAKAYKLLGVTKLTEKSRGMATALLAYCSSKRTGKFPSSVDLYWSVQNYQELLDSCVPPRHGLMMHVYPETAEGLSDELRAAAFPDDPPMAYDLPRVKQIFAHYVPLRSTSALLPPGFKDDIKAGIRRPARSYEENEARVNPVSYTHLTLPTKRIV